MEYVQLTLDDYIQCKTEIKENLTGIVKSFVKIGWQLTRINASKAYTLDGYSSITEFAKAEYDMNPDGVSRFMNVYERYSLPGDTPELQEQYKDFKFAQLSEMLQLTEEDQQLITPDTKRADIRELKKFNKENEHNPEQLLNWKNGEDNKIYKTVFEFFRASRETLNDLFGSDAYRAGDMGQMVDIVNPSGSRSYRKETVFLMMYGLDKGIMVKQIPQGTENMPWSEFFNIVQDLFGEKAAGSRTWEAYFEPESQKMTQPEKEASALEDTIATSEIAPAQKTDEKEEKSQETASVSEEIQPEPVETGGKNVEKPEEMEEPVEKQQEEKKEELPEEQIPGQDSILNHEEYMPKPVLTEETKEQSVSERENSVPEENEAEQLAAVREKISEEHEQAERSENTEKEYRIGENQEPSESKPEESREPQPSKESTPSAGIAPAQPHEVVDKPISRKEYLDSLTEYGAADHIAKAFESFGNVTFSQFKSAGFWERWLNMKVDHLGRNWVD
ncbi:hypothetical protein LIQ05_08955 [Blautia glucerasea]|uniref:hypothetical protein n=1 Tax=Blautia glucerasea TaxID=536633 RepID=UPI001D007EA1|nr:hypothetical protein [Blautia glucerasea]MCB5387119.1 hypothetical protein [Blautia glucerasea]MCB5421297.1 hypothetical protein [Blautia luti]